MRAGDLVSYRHDKTGKMRGIVLYVRKRYINSGPPERAMVHWNNPDDNEFRGPEDWVDDLEIISENKRIKSLTSATPFGTI